MQRCRSRQILGEIFPQTCPKSFCATFAYKYYPIKIMKTFLDVTSKKRSSCVFLQILGATFSSQTRLRTNFAHICKDFFQIFNGIFPDFWQIKTFVDALAPPHLHPYTFLWCRLWFYDCLSLDLQQKLKPFLHSSQEQMALRSFLGIHSSFV